MINFCKFGILVVCFVLSVSIASGQKVKPKAKTASRAPQTKVDLGTLRQNTYTNDTFELKIEFPLGWLVGDNVLEAQLMDIQKQSASPAVKQLMSRLTPLLGGYRSLPGSVAENSNLKITLENISDKPTIKTSQDYLKVIKTSLSKATLPAGFTASEIEQETIDNKSIDYLETRYGSNHKRSYVMLKKGFAVLITIDAYSAKDFEELHQILTEADLDYKK